MIDISTINELIIYIPESGKFLWKERPLEYFKGQKYCKSWNTRYAGKEAGTIHTNRKGKSVYQYISINILGKQVNAANLAWAIMTGNHKPEEMIVDHINRDATDNRWENLRLLSTAQNAMSRSMPSSNKSGFTGVFFRDDCNRWLAHGTLNRVSVSIGLYKTIVDAVAARLSWQREHNFDPTHGAPKSF